jgi:hypothetical protein
LERAPAPGAPEADQAEPRLLSCTANFTLSDQENPSEWTVQHHPPLRGRGHTRTTMLCRPETGPKSIARGVGLCVRTGNASAGTPILAAEIVVPSGDHGWDEDVRQGMIGRGAPSDAREWSPVWITDPNAPAPRRDFNCDHHPDPTDPHTNGR